MQHVYTARDAMEAHFVKGLLEAEGIKASVQGEALQETWGNLPLSAENLPSVHVMDDADALRAIPVIEEYRKRDQADAALEVGQRLATTDPIPARPTWKCPNCGEAVEEQFTACWHCGHGRPAENTALA